MDELVAWLGVQLDEDERTARAATWHDDAGTWTAHQSEYDSPRRSERRWFIIDSMDDGVITDVDPEASQPDGVARHVAEHDPARVLREISAKRQALAHYARVCQLTKDGDEAYLLAEGAVAKQIQIMATAYDHRPGYKESWRP